MIRRLLGTAVLLLAACVKREAVPAPAGSAQAEPGVHPTITLERTACFGSCPVYRVSVTDSGAVTYQGKEHVRRTGDANARIPPTQVAALLSEIEQSGYFSLDDRYVASEPGCGRYATDSPTVITSVTLRGRTKTITHDYGCSSVPGALTILERRIDETLGSGQWTGH
jgi:uncharacterized protein DUF6438